VTGGVNDTLASRIGLSELEKFGEGELGRVGNLPREMELDEFLDIVKTSLSCDSVRFANGYNVVRRVALVGGDGKDFVSDAIKTGADTYLSGRISYNLMEEAAELGINLIEAGHYHTEAPVLDFLAELLSTYDMSLTVDFADSNMIEMA
jgi:putative NIF3 family GTP cyclohydrolase 1 type 2